MTYVIAEGIVGTSRRMECRRAVEEDEELRI